MADVQAAFSLALVRIESLILVRMFLLLGFGFGLRSALRSEVDHRNVFMALPIASPSLAIPATAANEHAACTFPYTTKSGLR